MTKRYHIHDYEPPDDGDGGSPQLRWLAVIGAAIAWFWRKQKKGDGGFPPKEEIERGHRPVDDTPEGGVALFAVGLAVLLAVVLGGVWLLVDGLRGAQPDQLQAEVPYAGYTATPSRPQLQSDPALELREVREREERQLHGYRWVDSSAGVISIPIDRAIQLFADTAAVDPEGLDSILVLTESGYVYRTISLPEVSAPPYLGRSPEPYAVDPDIAEILRYVDVKADSVIEGMEIGLEKLRGRE